MRRFAIPFVSLILCLLMLVGCGSNMSNTNKTASKSSTSNSSDKAESSQSDDSTETDNNSSKVEQVSSRYWQSYSDEEQEQESLIVPDKTVTGNTCVLMGDIKGGANETAAAKRKSIINAKDSLSIAGKTYYISPKGNDENDGLSPKKAWKSTDALGIWAANIQRGDAVLFERGNIYRTNSSIVCKSGVTYGAYGSGDKPVIYGSVQNYSQPDLWTPSTKKNVWKLDLPLTDAGIIVFNNGESVGVKQSGLLSMTKNGDYYHNVTDNTLYLYLDKGRPNQVYSSIEIGTRRAIFTIQFNNKNINIDNLCMKYTGTFGVQCNGNQNNVHITNCEIGWIGGSYQNPDDPNPARYGNGVQFWDTAKNCSIDNCWVYQVYDAGITFQCNENQVYENIDFNNNLIEYCSYNIEFFMRPKDQSRNILYSDEGKMLNINMNNNILRMSGYGWGSQRGNSSAVSSINGWFRYYENCTNFNIRNNIFDCSTRNLVYWLNVSMKDEQIGLNVSGNTFYQKANESNMALGFGISGQTYANNQESLVKAVLAFDKNPKEIKWIS